MAKTGVTTLGIRPVTETDVEIHNMPEGASIAVTTKMGALMQNTAGYMTLPSGAVNSAWGFLLTEKCHNNTSNGDKNIAVCRLKQGALYEITVTGVAAVTDTDAKIAITQTSGVPTAAVTDTSADGRLIKFIDPFAVGDTSARALVTFFDSFIEQSGGNE